MEVPNQILIALEIAVFVVLGLFGNFNFLCLTYTNPQLRSKSSYLQCALSVSHIFCLLFELPNAGLLFTGIQLKRSVCFPAIAIYIFFICAQAVIMLLLVVDIFLIVFFPAFYRRVDNFSYTLGMLLLPFAYSAFTVIWGFMNMNDELVSYCNPPVGLHPTVSRWWSLSNVVLNTTTFILFVVLITIFHYRGKKQRSDTRQVMKRLQVSVVVFILSWYIAILGVDLFTTLGYQGQQLATFQSNMIFFALLCYTQSFYVILWRAAEYRKMSSLVELGNQIFIASEIVLFNVLGLFGNFNVLCLIYAKTQLRSKSSYIQCALSISHIFCLLFELPNAVLLFTGIQLKRNVCFPAISIYIFFICAQAVIMLMLVVDLFIIVFFSAYYRRIDNLSYTLMMLSPPFVYSAFTVAWGFVKMDDELVIFCNPPIGLHPIVSRWWSFSNVTLNSVTLFLFLFLMVIFHFRGKKQKSDTRKLMNRLKVSVVVFIFSWYMCTLGVDMFAALGFTGSALAFFQSNMVFFALLCYTQPFYVILWRSSEYRLAFVEFWSMPTTFIVVLVSLLLIGNNEAQLGQLFQPFVVGPENPNNRSHLVLTQELCAQDECILQKGWTQEDVCAYIKCNNEACEGGGYLQWSAYVKCEHRTTVRVILIIVSIVYLFFLFVVMTVVADDFFSPSIAGIVRHLKISESIAGVTFLAFGNGAPDVFGSIASVITSPKPKADLAIGDILGGGIFVTTVVLSAIIITKSFRIAVTFLGLYAAYVVSVILMRWNSKKRKRVRQLKAEKARKESTVNHHTHKISTVISVLMDYAHVLNFLANNKITAATANVKSFLDGRDFENKDLEGLVDDQWDGDDEGIEAEFHIAHRHVYKSYDEASLAFTEVEEIQPKSWKSWDWVRDLANHLRPWPTRDQFCEHSLFSKIISIVAVLPTFFLKLTVPSNEMPWSKPLLIVHCFCSIQFALFAIQISDNSPFHGSPGLWLYGLFVSTCLSLLALMFTPLDREQKHYREVYSYFGFLMSIAWIYVTSSEIINVITMIGVLTGISQEILGLTIMAWSNCIGDVVSDIAVVKQGFPKMAMAAAIGGPLFNLLVGFGLPFTIACLQGKQIDLQINPIYRLLILFLGISLITSLIG
ncbi:unnamed protein product [Caenorhabditis sp. 36 PRJEB53466]|nr:unnamed protein product [Caenorhabditis sp. 36 PRJEB53466]